MEGALGGMVGRPVGSELSDVYPWLAGLALDVRIRHSPHLSLSIQVAPVLGRGTPHAGSLAEDPEGQLLLLPGYLLVEYSHGRGPWQPYVGAGVGAVYVSERLSFMSPAGTKEPSVSATRLAFDVLVGVERLARTTPFAELHYQHAGLSGVEEQSGSGVNLSSLQVRFGVRTRLK